VQHVPQTRPREPIPTETRYAPEPAPYTGYYQPHPQNVARPDQAVNYYHIEMQEAQQNAFEAS